MNPSFVRHEKGEGSRTDFARYCRGLPAKLQDFQMELGTKVEVV